MIVASHHGPYLCDSGASKRIAQGFEELGADALQANLGANLNCENPATGGLAKLPGTDFANNESLNLAVAFGNQENLWLPASRTISGERFFPVPALREAGDFFIQRNQRRQVRRNSWPDDKFVRAFRDRTRFHDGNMCRGISPSTVRCGTTSLLCHIERE